MSNARRFLFLQGNASRFFDRLARALDAKGHAVHRINFNGGDWAFWSLPGAVSFRGKLDQWPAYLQSRLVEWKITDIVLFGDCRPLHRVAIVAARPRGICVHVCDEGYLRPNWITVEEGGVNGHSALHRDIGLFRRTSAFLPPWSGGAPVLNSGVRRALDDILYLVCSLLLWWRYPGYRTHRPHHKLVEYAGGARRFLRRPLARLWLRRDVRRIRQRGQPHYVFPLQLEADSQIRYHSDFASISSAIELVVRSFATHAPAQSVLAVTEHPLDTSLSNWRRVVRRFAKACGVADRVFFLEGGTPELLLQDCRGVVTVNSTVGYLALTFGRPVVTLGEAIYDMHGLTFQGTVDAFWSSGQPANPADLDAFRRVVAAQAQINGGYFSRHGIELAVQGLLARWAERAPMILTAANDAASPTAETLEFPKSPPVPAPVMAVSSQA